MSLEERVDPITELASIRQSIDNIDAALMSEQAEGISDSILDGVADFANKVTGDKFSDQIKGARDAADGAVGNE